MSSVSTASDTQKFTVALAFCKLGSAQIINVRKPKEDEISNYSRICKGEKNDSNILQLFRNLFLIIGH